MNKYSYDIQIKTGTQEEAEKVTRAVVVLGAKLKTSELQKLAYIIENDPVKLGLARTALNVPLHAGIATSKQAHEYEIEISAADEDEAERKMKALIVLASKLSPLELEKLADIVLNDPAKTALAKSALGL